MKKLPKKTIWVNLVPRISVQGRDKQVYSIKTGEGLIPTTRMDKHKEHNAIGEYQFLINPTTGRLQTGLNKEIPNPFKGFTTEEIISGYGLSQEWRKHLEKILEHKSITKQTYYEILHGRNPNDYTDEVKWYMGNMPGNMDKFHNERTYLQDLKLILYPRPNRFTNDTPRQQLLMEMIYNLPEIAHSKNQANSSLHNWYISQENEEEEAVARKSEIIEEAVYNLHKLKHEYGKFRSYQTAIILRDNESRPLVKGEVTSDKVSQELSRFIREETRYQMEHIATFMEVMDLLKTEEGADRFQINYLVQQALNTNVIAHRDNQYIWHSKAGTPDVYKLGSSFDKLINFFLKEFKQYNPETDITNWYGDLYEEVKSKGIKLSE